MQEINELKNVVIQTLEQQGSLCQIRAQIRASVFKVIDQQETNQNKESPFYWENAKCQKLFNSEEGKILLSLIKEFLQFYNMDYSLSVYSSESNLREEVNRDNVCKRLNLNSQQKDKSLLAQLIDNYQSGKAGEPVKAAIKTSQSNPSPPLNSNIAAAASSKKVIEQQKNDNSKSITTSLDKKSIQSSAATQQVSNSISSSNNVGGGTKGADQSKYSNIPASKNTAAPSNSATQSKTGGIPAKGGKDSGSNQMQESDNYDQPIDESLGDFEEIQLDDELGKSEDIKESKTKSGVNFGFSSDDHGASQSMKYDQTVDSLALENYDYYEEAVKKK